VWFSFYSKWKSKYCISFHSIAQILYVQLKISFGEHVWRALFSVTKGSPKGNANQCLPYLFLAEIAYENLRLSSSCEFPSTVQKFLTFFFCLHGIYPRNTGLYMTGQAHVNSETSWRLVLLMIFLTANRKPSFLKLYSLCRFSFDLKIFAVSIVKANLDIRKVVC